MVLSHLPHPTISTPCNFYLILYMMSSLSGCHFENAAIVVVSRRVFNNCMTGGTVASETQYLECNCIQGLRTAEFTICSNPRTFSSICISDETNPWSVVQISFLHTKFFCTLCFCFCSFKGRRVSSSLPWFCANSMWNDSICWFFILLL